MTCVVWSKGALATDRNVAYNSRQFSDYSEKKIDIVGDYLLGFSGRNYVKDKIIEWIKTEFNPEQKPRLETVEEFDAILVNYKTKTLYLATDKFEFNQYPYDYDLVGGSLRLFAKGALVMGASAKEAVQVALRSFELRPEAKFLEVDEINVDSLLLNGDENENQ